MALSRRQLFAGASALALGGAAAPPALAAPTMVGAGDQAEYQRLVSRGYNRRFAARPRQIFTPTTAQETADAVGQAVREGLRIAVRSGGQCFEDFVDGGHTQALIDLSAMAEVRRDGGRRFVIGPGAELGSVYQQLHRGWGVTLPAGICLGVGMGGHVCGGGYGPLSRRHGLVVDHLRGVELVHVDATGAPKIVTATADGPHADLFWAHTGGGGGNFGVVTKFLFSESLPTPPRTMMSTRIVTPLPTEQDFVRFVGNFLRFFEQHSAPGDRFAGLHAPLHILPGAIAELQIILDADTSDAQVLFTEFLTALGHGVTVPLVPLPVTHASYPDTVTQAYYAKNPLPPRVKVKSAYLRRAYSDDQLRTCYRYFTDLRFVGESQLEFMPFGGAINSRPAGATAFPARSSFAVMLIHASWRDAGEDAKYLTWARSLYRDLYPGTGGVPVPDDANGGSYLNYPDPDLADPQWNRSGTPWHRFYYGANYPTLQRVKATWDPKNIFRHQLSITP